MQNMLCAGCGLYHDSLFHLINHPHCHPIHSSGSIPPQQLEKGACEWKHEGQKRHILSLVNLKSGAEGGCGGYKFPLQWAKLAQLRNPQNESTFFSLFIFLSLPPQKRTWFPSSCFFSLLAILKYSSVGRVVSVEGELEELQSAHKAPSSSGHVDACFFASHLRPGAKGAVKTKASGGWGALSPPVFLSFTSALPLLASALFDFPSAPPLSSACWKSWLCCSRHSALSECSAFHIVPRLQFLMRNAWNNNVRGQSEEPLFSVSSQPLSLRSRFSRWRRCPLQVSLQVQIVSRPPGAKKCTLDFFDFFCAHTKLQMH